MAKKISDLPEASELQGPEQIELVQSGQSRRGIISQIQTFVLSALGALATKDQAEVPGDLNATGTPDGTTFLRGDGQWAVPGGGGADTFLELTDTPAAYAGDAGKPVIVNVAEDALEFAPGVLLHADGVAATPAYSFTADPDTGFYGNGANAMIASLGGVGTYAWTTTSLRPVVNNVGALGAAPVAWSDLFLGDGAVIGFNNGDVTITHGLNFLQMEGGTLVLPATGLQIAFSIPFSDSAGTLTLQNIDVLDATTEATIEAAIDTLANLTSIQGVSFTFGAYAATVLNNANEAAFKVAVNLEIGVDVQAFDADLAALAALGSTGIAVRTAANTWAQRTLTGTANQIEVANGDGVAGNPVVSAHIASQAEAEAGTDSVSLMTAERTAQAIAALGGGGSGLSDVVTQVFTASGTYTPTAGMAFCRIRVQAPGGGGGGADIDDGADSAAGGGGGGGEYAEGWFDAADIGASKAVTIGAVGAAGANTGANGGTGGTTSVGVLITAIGGIGGGGANPAAGNDAVGAGGAGGTGGSGGGFRVPGQAGTESLLLSGNFFARDGGNSQLGAGARGTPVGVNIDAAGNSGSNYGGGGSGAARTSSLTGGAGGAGGPGIVIIEELIQ